MEKRLDSLQVTAIQNSFDSRNSNHVSVPTAFNMLKEMEDRLSAAKMRMKAKLMKEERIQKLMQEQQRVYVSRSLLNQQKQKNKEEKIEAQFLKLSQLERQRNIISMSRMEKKKKREYIIQDQQIAKHDMYLACKKQSKVWDAVIDKNKKRFLLQKRTKRSKVAKDQEKSRAKTKQKMGERISRIQKMKNTQVEQIKKVINCKEKIISDLQQATSLTKIRQSYDSNPEEFAGRISTLYSDHQSRKGRRKLTNVKILDSREMKTTLNPIRQAKVVMYGSHGKTVIYDKV